MRTRVLPVLVASLAILAILGLTAGCRRPAFLGGVDESAPKPVVCLGRYALCTSAACTPVPQWNAKSGKIEVTKALCECLVANGPSLGDLPCSTRKPQGDGRYLVSTFSFGETATHPAMTCQAGTPWAYCYDQPCTVDPKDPTKAQCTCAVRSDGEYETLGGGCDKSKCGTALWVGANPAAAKGAASLLAQDEGLKAVPENRCP